MIDRDRLKQLLTYEPVTGLFRWRISRTFTARAGTIAGSLDQTGYIVIRIGKRSYKAHRLAWFYVHGEWTMLDHRDGVATNNQLDNLRPATQSENCANRRRQGRFLKGVYYNKRDRLWTARIQKDGDVYQLGCFKSEQAAHAAYCAKAIELYGEFARFA